MCVGLVVVNNSKQLLRLQLLQYAVIWLLLASRSAAQVTDTSKEHAKLAWYAQPPAGIMHATPCLAEADMQSI